MQNLPVTKIRLSLWQGIVLAAPMAIALGFILVAAGHQIYVWKLNWVWGVFVLMWVGWRWLLVRWTRPAIAQMKGVISELNAELNSELNSELNADPHEESPPKNPQNAQQKAFVVNQASIVSQAEVILEQRLQNARQDPPFWEDWLTFWNRCLELVQAIAHLYYPDVKYPLLQIYIPDAYGLVRGTVDDMDKWMQKLSPVLSQVTIGQAYQGYEVYRKIEPTARRVLQLWDWAQWVLNPSVAIAKIASQRYTDRANQELLINLSQLVREVALRNLCRQAIALYSRRKAEDTTELTQTSSPTLVKAKTQTLRAILEQAEPLNTAAQKPLNLLLMGRTGAGKSSLINTLFQTERAAVDLLPLTSDLQCYHWQIAGQNELNLWDTPGYEQIKGEELLEQVLDYGQTADGLILVTPALDPALQMDEAVLNRLRTEGVEAPAIAVVTQVDRLRPLREWNPPYDWQQGDRPKEIAIREAVRYRVQRLGVLCDPILPLVTFEQTRPTGIGDTHRRREAWGVEAVSIALMEAIAPAKQLRLARLLRNLDARTLAAAKIIDHYTFQMATTQGLTALLKSPVLQFISTLTTGTPTLAYILAEQIPVEQLPVVIGKLQMAYELFSLLNSNAISLNKISSAPPSSGEPFSHLFELRNLWPLLLDNPASPDQNAWAFGHALMEYWTQNLSLEQLRQRYQDYIKLLNI